MEGPLSSTQLWGYIFLKYLLWCLTLSTLACRIRNVESKFNFKKEKMKETISYERRECETIADAP